MAIGFELRTHGFVRCARIFQRAVDKMKQHTAAFGVAEKSIAQPYSIVCAFDQAGQVSQHEFATVHSDHTELWMQRGEWIVGDLRFGRADRGKERGLAGIGQTDQPGIGDQLQAQANSPLFARLARIGVSRCAIGRRLEMCVAKAAIAALGDPHPLANVGEIRNQRLAIFFVDLRTNRDLQHDVFAVGAGAILAHTVAAALRLEMLLVAIVDQRIEAGNGLHHDVAAITTVAPIGPTELDEFLAAERYAAVPARAGRNIDLGFIEEFHGFRVYRIARAIGERSGGNKSWRSPI